MVACAQDNIALHNITTMELIETVCTLNVSSVFYFCSALQFFRLNFLGDLSLSEYFKC